MTRVNGHTADEVIEAIRASHGILAAAARKLGVTRQTVHRYVVNYPTIKAAVDEEREKFLDMAEAGLAKHVRRGSLPAIMFALKTVGRSRGYIERQELAGVPEAPISVVLYLPDNQRDGKS